MIGRLVLAALIAGMAAGILMGGIQHVRITPLILEAEVFEKAAEAATTATNETAPAATTPEHSVGTPVHEHAAGEWEPTDGLQRTLLTTLATIIAGAGFAGVLAGVSLLTGIPITPRNGLIWGLCGFLAVTVAPGAGLAPELPGMPAADVFARQVWWVGTIAATGIGIYLIAVRREFMAIAIAIALIALPHLIGAPQAPSHESTVPAGLAAEFAANTIAAAAIFWSLIGVFLGLALKRFSKEIYTT